MLGKMLVAMLVLVEDHFPPRAGMLDIVMSSIFAS